MGCCCIKGKYFVVRGKGVGQGSRLITIRRRDPRLGLIQSQAKGRGNT